MEPVPRPTRTFAALFLAGALAGCTTSSTRPQPVTRFPNPSPVTVVPQPRVPTPQPRTVPSTPPPPVAKPAAIVVTPSPPTTQQTLPPAVTNRPPAPPPAVAVNGWVPLEGWSAARGFGRPLRHATSTNLWHLPTPYGVLALTVGSLSATWNGTKLSLGFAPQISSRQLFVHALDAQKVLLPLMSPQTLPPRGARVIVLDPGHGGDNHGTKSVHNNKLEKELALDWARRLKPLLEARGWRVILTRTTDTALSLSERVAIADQFRAHFFLSLHFNSGPSSQSGLETYCLTPTGMASTLTRDFKDDPSESLPNNVFDAQNLQYAMRLHRAVQQETHGLDRGVRHARFMAVLRTQNRPAVLIEGGYLSNPHEAQLISTETHRQRLALAVAKALD